MIKTIRLENGLRLVYEKIPFVRSVSIGLWVGTGSCNESLANNGISHFIEHMLFKGTKTRTAKEIAREMDQIGGQMNAFTGKECTCYYAKSLDTHMEHVFDLLSDMFLHARFAEKDLEVERNVILEEIRMVEDTPEELVHDLFTEMTWPSHPLGLSILGTEESLMKMDETAIRHYIEERVHPQNTVLAVAGNFDEATLQKLADRYFGRWTTQKPLIENQDKATFQSQITTRVKDIEQAHLCLGFEGVTIHSKSLYDMNALSNILGGGMSSRLFQRIREERGLAYSIYTYPTAYLQGGLFNIYVGTNPEYVPEVLHLIADELLLLKKNGVLESELNITKEQLKANYIMGLESTSGRMHSIGKSMLLRNLTQTTEEVLAKIDQITKESLHELINNRIQLDRVSIIAIGGEKLEEKLSEQVNRVFGTSF